jgi:hypothetical protein
MEQYDRAYDSVAGAVKGEAGSGGGTPTEAVVRAKHLYLALCLVGTVLPVAAFLPFVRAHGLDVGEFLAQLFPTPVSGFFVWDVIVSSVVLWAFVYVEGRWLTMGNL